jgi:cytochrome c-type biogenesis protein CcmH/NrfG
VINYRNAIQRDPQLGEAYYQLGLTEIHLNQRQEAFQNQKANAVKPMQPELILSWTHALFQDSQQADGERLAGQLIEINRNDRPIYDECLPSTYC